MPIKQPAMKSLESTLLGLLNNTKTQTLSRLMQRIVQKFPIYIFLLIGMTACGDRQESHTSSPFYHSHNSRISSQEYNEEMHIEMQNAKEEYESAASELRGAVEDLNHMPWDLQMTEIRSRMDDLESSLIRLEGINPNDQSVINARSEFENFQTNMDRLSFENWRNVAPALDEGSDILESESINILEDEFDE